MSEWNVSVEPPSEPRSGESAFTNKAHIDEWVESLPAAATGEASRKIYLALEDLALHRINPTTRFHFLERTGVLFYGMLRSLERNVYRGGFPLKDASSKTARLLLSMLALKVINYRLVMDDLNKSLFAGGLKRQNIFQHSLLRILEYLGEIFELYRHLDVPPSPGLWNVYNRFFAIAEAEKMLTHRLKSMDGHSHTTLNTEFCLQQLLDPLNPHDFRHSEYHCIKQAIRILAEGGLKKDGNIDNPHGFCLRLDEDAPISFFEPERAVQHQDSPLRRCLNIRPLADKLQSFLDEDLDTMNLNSCQLSRHAARMMLAGWAVQQDTRSQRVDALQNVHLAHGLSNIALVILNSRVPKPGSTPDTSRDGEAVVISGDEHLFKSFDVDGIDITEHTINIAKAGDIWDTAYINIVEPASHWADSYRKDTDAVIVEAQLVNQSPKGFAIELNQSYQEHQFQIGDLIAVEIDNDWLLVSIRWIRRHEERVRVGLRKLGTNLHTQTLIVSRKGNPSQPMPVLLIDHIRGIPAVVLHNINIHPRDTIAFVDGDAHIAMQVGELLDTSAVFECYHLDRNTLQ